MSKAQVDKLVRKGLAQDVAEDLTDAGFYTPAKIRAASNAELEDVVGSAKRATLRQTLPSRN